jgi:hypothetical protein
MDFVVYKFNQLGKNQQKDAMPIGIYFYQNI